MLSFFVCIVFKVLQGYSLFLVSMAIRRSYAFLYFVRICNLTSHPSLKGISHSFLRNSIELRTTITIYGGISQPEGFLLRNTLSLCG